MQLFARARSSSPARRTRNLFDSGQDWILDADALHVTLSPEGAAQSISARGTASLRLGEEDDPQALFGDRIDGFLDDAGHIRAVEATGSARMELGPDEELRSARIRNELSGRGSSAPGTGNSPSPLVLSTSEDSFLRLGDVRLRGRDFEIERASLVRFRTDQSSDSGNRLEAARQGTGPPRLSIRRSGS